MRLDKYLAETAQCTRSEAKALLSKGRVQVNGAVCKKGDTQLRETDTVAVDGKALNYQQFVYLMLNKPEGVVSASTDKRDTTVVDLVGDAYPRRQLFPAGRLDKTSTGFVLLTDDGTFAHEILAPKRHVSKTYTVVLDTPLTEEMRTGFAAGGVFVLGAGNFCHGIVADHAVHIAAADEKAVLRLAEPLEVLAVGIAGLCQYAHLVALGFQQAADDGSAKAGVVHIGVTAHHHKVQLLPAPGFHVRPADGKKFGVDLGSSVVHLLISSFLVEHGQRPRPLSPLRVQLPK